MTSPAFAYGEPIPPSALPAPTVTVTGLGLTLNVSFGKGSASCPASGTIEPAEHDFVLVQGGGIALYNSTDLAKTTNSTIVLSATAVIAGSFAVVHRVRYICRNPRNTTKSRCVSARYQGSYALLGGWSFSVTPTQIGVDCPT